MTSREKTRLILDKKNTGRTGFWLGAPKAETFELYKTASGAETNEELYNILSSDFLNANPKGYNHPEGKPIFDTGQKKNGGHNNSPGRFAECTDIKEVDAIDWPNPDYMDFTELKQWMQQYQDKGILTGIWSPFFHTVANYFGMENYFIKMYTYPGVVEAVTEHVLDFYIGANQKFYRDIGDLTDVFFFGNDFGTQQDLLISPECFKKFILPGMKRLINTGKQAGKKIVLHSCGAIYRIIPLLIDAGIDMLHPLQAMAKGMSAKDLTQYKDDIAFMGGIDTQNLLIKGTPSQIKDDVRRVRDLLGPNLIISPSHETLLPNVPYENVAAMSMAAHE